MIQSRAWIELCDHDEVKDRARVAPDTLTEDKNVVDPRLGPYRDIQPNQETENNRYQEDTVHKQEGIPAWNGIPSTLLITCADG